MNRHQQLAAWAADCAERVLALFEAERGEDERPRQAIEAARLWQRGDMTMVMARRKAFAAHSAARQATSASAIAAARAAGHAAATAHVETHAVHAARYAQKARGADGEGFGEEREWQIRCLPEGLENPL